MSWYEVQRTRQPIAKCDYCGKFISTKSDKSNGYKHYNISEESIERHDYDLDIKTDIYLFKCHKCFSKHPIHEGHDVGPSTRTWLWEGIHKHGSVDKFLESLYGLGS